MWYFEKRSYLSKKNQWLAFSRKYRLSTEESYKNLALIAPTWSWKTTRYVIPNILQWSWSIVVTDPSGEIHRKTSGYMQKRGYKIQVLQPANLSQSLKFNPVDRFNTAQEIKQLATILASQNAGNDPFWSSSAITVLQICLSAIKKYWDETKDKSKSNIWYIRKLLSEFTVKWWNTEKFLEKYLDDTLFNEYKAFRSKDSKMTDWILWSVSTSIEKWTDPEIIKFTSENTVNIEALRHEKTIIYIIVPEHKIKYFSVLINLFYSACFEYCLENPNWNPVYFFLDEFWNLWKINNFAQIATTLRKRKCSINIILQELSQLEEIYWRHGAKSIYSWWMANKLFFSWCDLETCQYLERVLGNTTQQETVEEESKQWQRTITTWNPLMTADQIRMMDNEIWILISWNKRPIKLKMKPYFKDRILNKYTRIKQFNSY